MRGRERGSGRKSEFLNKLFGNKKRTILLSLAVAATGYVLFLIFGDIHAAEDALYHPVVMGGFAFVGMFLVCGFQLINPYCNAKAMDNMELYFALASGPAFVIWLMVKGIRVMLSSESYLGAAIFAEVAGTWCALCLIHYMRK